MASHKRVVWRLSGDGGAKIAADQPTKPTEALTKEEPWPSPIKPWLYPSRSLQDYWSSISAKFPDVDDITVIGIDLTKRSS
jgi:hypothetical protein